MAVLGLSLRLLAGPSICAQTAKGHRQSAEPLNRAVLHHRPALDPSFFLEVLCLMSAESSHGRVQRIPQLPDGQVTAPYLSLLSHERCSSLCSQLPMSRYETYQHSVNIQCVCVWVDGWLEAPLLAFVSVCTRYLVAI